MLSYAGAKPNPTSIAGGAAYDRPAQDHRFRDHHGVDWRRTAASVLHTLGGDPQGGSTLTQQLARNLFPDEIGRDRSLNRKLREIITALRIERLYSKDEILETYLNTADFLYNAVGIEAAARTYFNKPASALDMAEAATLVGMLKGTSHYNPVLQPERSKARRNVVLAQTVKRCVLAPAQFAALKDTPLAVRLTREADPLGSAQHFALHARKWLVEWAQKNDHDLYQEGLTIVTTLDTRLQAAASQAVSRQAALLQQVADVEWSQPTLRVASANIDAYEKARPKVDPFGHFWGKRRDLVTAFVRESFKPFVYGAALAAGARSRLDRRAPARDAVAARAPDPGAPRAGRGRRLRARKQGRCRHRPALAARCSRAPAASRSRARLPPRAPAALAARAA